MKHPAPIRSLVFLLMAALVPTAAHAAPGGLLRTLLLGYWVCETKGDAETAPRRLLDDSFRIVPDSSYRTAKGVGGSYLLLGNDLMMTSGPFRSRKYILVGLGILHPINASGQRTSDRCVRQSSASALEAGNDRDADAREQGAHDADPHAGAQ
ncbi:hypothetical protein [Novosphingobium sp.]|uniref:hypothetical protein n=1 Tax=Novosphingobium sp. TaxID=1874826 RepID=UPI003D129B97